MKKYIIILYTKEISIVEISIVENSIEKGTKVKRVKDDTLLSFYEYQKLYPEKELTSLKKYLSTDNPTHDGAISWCEREFKKKPMIFDKPSKGLFKAWCSKCGNQEFPNNKWQLEQGSECCGVEYTNKKPMAKKNTD